MSEEPETSLADTRTDEHEQPDDRLRGSLDWLPVSLAVPAVVGAVLPWFAPTGTGQGGGLQIAAAYCWQAGRIGFLAPLALGGKDFQHELFPILGRSDDGGEA